MSQDKNLTETKFQPSRPANLAALVDYQSGSTARREILKGATGSVTLLAFDEGEGVREHSSPSNALVQVIEGEAEITFSGQARRVKTGELILVSAQQPHALRALKRLKMVLTKIQP